MSDLVGNLEGFLALQLKLDLILLNAVCFQNRHIVAEMEPALQVANQVHRRLKKIDKV